jgi:hypothetical protein
MTHTTHENHTHAHEANCGHTQIKHGDHTDYLHDGHLHKMHDAHVDECTIEVSDQNPANAPKPIAAARTAATARTKPCRTAITPIIWLTAGCIIITKDTATITAR